MENLNNCAGILPVNGTAEQPVLPPHCEWTDRILAEIIGKAAAPVFQIGLCCITPVQDIINRFIHPGIPDWLPLFIIAGILFVNGILDDE